MLAKTPDTYFKLSVRVDYGPQPMWDEMLRLSALGGFTKADVAHGAKISINPVRDYIKRLTRGGYVTKIATIESTQEGVYQITSAQPEAPRLLPTGKPCTQRTIAEYIWRAIKMMGARSWTTEQLATLASTEDILVKKMAAGTYVRALIAAGYVRKSGDPKAAAQHYALVPGMNTGPLPPILQRARFVYDANKGEIVGGPVLAEEVTL